MPEWVGEEPTPHSAPAEWTNEAADTGDILDDAPSPPPDPPLHCHSITHERLNQTHLLTCDVPAR